MMFTPTRFAWVVMLLICAAAYGNHADACKVPVFRYALERWPADDYRIVAIVDGTQNVDATDALKILGESKANVEIETIDLSQLTETELWQVEGLDDAEQTPILQVFYPQRSGQRQLCWSGELTVANVKAWSNSALRRQIVADIQSGVSAVWVMVDGNDAAENVRVKSTLEAALSSAAAEIAIPAEVIRRVDAASYLKEHPSASMDDVLRSDIPLKIDFSIRQFSDGSPEELAMRAMIDGWGDNMVDPPYVFPVFGRGRMIEPLGGDRVDSEAIIAACRYLVGECSCSVKALSPGIDLMLNTDWKENVGSEIVMVGTSVATTPATISIPPGNPSTSVEKTQDTSHSRNLITVGCVLVGILFGSFWLFRMRHTVKAS